MTKANQRRRFDSGGPTISCSKNAARIDCRSSSNRRIVLATGVSGALAGNASGRFTVCGGSGATTT